MKDLLPAHAVRRDRRLIDGGLKDILAEDIFKESKAPLRFAASPTTAAPLFQVNRNSTREVMSLCCDQDFLQNQQVWLYKPMHYHAECSDGYGRLVYFTSNILHGNPDTSRDAVNKGNTAAGTEVAGKEGTPAAQKAQPGRKKAKGSVDVGRPITDFFSN